MEFEIKHIKDEEVIRRYELICPLIEMPYRTREDVNRYAEPNDVSSHTLYRYIRKYEEAGKKGLVPKV